MPVAPAAMVVAFAAAVCWAAPGTAVRRVLHGYRSAQPRLPWPVRLSRSRRVAPPRSGGTVQPLRLNGSAVVGASALPALWPVGRGCAARPGGFPHIATLTAEWSPTGPTPGLTRRPASDLVWLIRGRTPFPTEPGRPALPEAPTGGVAGVAHLRGGWDGFVTVAAHDGTRVLCSRDTQTVGADRITSYRYAVSSTPRDPALGTAVDLGVEPGAFTVLLERLVHADGTHSDAISITLNDGAGRARGFTDATVYGHDRSPPVVAISPDRRTARFTGNIATVSDEIVDDVPTSRETVTAAIRCPSRMAPPGH